jgi:hypothetical protein
MKGTKNPDDAVAPIELPVIDLTTIVHAVADHLAARLQAAAGPTVANEPLLLTIEQASRKLGRSVPATEHLIRKGTLRTVRFDGRISVDYRDILALIERSKQPSADKP